MNNNHTLTLLHNTKIGVLSTLVGLASLSAQASMGNLGMTYGALPSDVASVQALSLFNTQTSALYYNPAALVQDPRGELTMGLLHAQHNLTLDGKVLEDSPSQQVLLGMKTNLSSLTKFQRPLYFGVMLGVEQYGKEMMSFSSETSTSGQYFEYGRQPLFLVLGGGTKIWRGIDAGLSMRVTLHAASRLQAVSNMAGKTEHEELEVSARQKLSPILGVNVNWGETLSSAPAWLKNTESAFTFRRFSNTKTSVDAGVTIPGTIPSPGMAMIVTTLDSYQPNIFAVGSVYGQKQHYRVGVTLEMQQWSRLEDEFKRDTIKDQALQNGSAQLQFRDTFIPRLGAEVWLNKDIKITSGLAYVQSPLQSNTSLNVNYLDTDKVQLGLGLSMQFANPPLLAFPIRADLGYQYQYLLSRDFDYYSTAVSTPQPYAQVEAGGDVNVFSASVSLQF